jgi:ubiquinone biosynthesis accessory factor UbiK
MSRSPFDELSEQLARLLPQANALGEEFRASVKLAMEKTFSKMDLLTREEFEAQSRALQRAEEKIAELEIAIREIEEKLQK